MNFTINNLNWTIIELSQKEMKVMQNKRRGREEDNPESLDLRYFGLTYHDTLEIYLDKALPTERKKKTLIHELTHCYISSFITHQEKNYNEEDVADIVANSIEIIADIVEKYFKRTEDR